MKNKSRRSNNSSRRKSRPAPATGTTSNSASSDWRIAKILLVSAAGVAVCLAIAVLVTPLEDPQTAPQLGLDTPRGPAPKTPENEVRSSASQLPSFPEPTLQIPKTPTSIDVADLQAELRELAEELVTEYPSEAGAFHFAAQIYFELKQTEQAEQLWKKSLELSSTAAGPYGGLAALLVGSGRETEAIDLVVKAHEQNVQSAETYAQLAEAYWNLGQLEDAQRTLTEALEQYPDDGKLWLAQGRGQNQLQEFAAAEQSLKKAISQSGVSENALFLLSTAQLRQGKTEEAAETRQQLQAIRKPATARPVDTEVRFQEIYESALRRIAVDVYVSSAALAEQYERLEDAERYLLRAIELAPGHGMTLMSLSAILRKQGRLPDALQVQQRLLEIQPDNLMNYTNLASVALQTGDLELARETLLNAAQTDPQGVVAQALLAKLYLAEQQLPEARRYAELVLERNPSVESYLLLASVYRAEGDEAAVANMLDKARMLDPNHPIWSQ